MTLASTTYRFGRPRKPAPAVEGALRSSSPKRTVPAAWGESLHLVAVEQEGSRLPQHGARAPDEHVAGALVALRLAVAHDELGQAEAVRPRPVDRHAVIGPRVVLRQGQEAGRALHEPRHPTVDVDGQPRADQALRRALDLLDRSQRPAPIPDVRPVAAGIVESHLLVEHLAFVRQALEQPVDDGDGVPREIAADGVAGGVASGEPRGEDEVRRRERARAQQHLPGAEGQPLPRRRVDGFDLGDPAALLLETRHQRPRPHHQAAPLELGQHGGRDVVLRGDGAREGVARVAGAARDAGSLRRLWPGAETA